MSTNTLTQLVTAHLEHQNESQRAADIILKTAIADGLDLIRAGQNVTARLVIHAAAEQADRLLRRAVPRSPLTLVGAP